VQEHRPLVPTKANSLSRRVVCNRQRKKPTVQKFVSVSCEDCETKHSSHLWTRDHRRRLSSGHENANLHRYGFLRSQRDVRGNRVRAGYDGGKSPLKHSARRRRTTSQRRCDQKRSTTRHIWARRIAVVVSWRAQKCNEVQNSTPRRSKKRRALNKEQQKACELDGYHFTESVQRRAR